MNQLRQKRLFIYLFIFIFESKEGKKKRGRKRREREGDSVCGVWVETVSPFTRSAHPVRTPAVAGVCRRRRVEEEDRGGFLLI